MSVDIFQHHNGVVYQHAGRQGQSAQAHQVEVDFAEVQQGEGDKNRDRNRYPDHDRAPEIVQEENQHYEGQDGADEERFDQAVKRLPDVVGVPVDEFVLQVGIILL